ncbi:MAG: M23 family metallopeptidase [Tissierellia bacterium]|nr:M23 family metallopeptidase [Tissierellia bacterium]
MYKRRSATKYRGVLNFLKRRLHYKKKINQIICVLIILILIFILKRLNNNLSSNIIQIIDNSIRYDFSIKKDGRVILDYGKKLLILPEKALSVINLKNNPKYLPPIEGAIYNPFGQIKYLDGSTSFNEGVDVIPKEGKEPISIEEGIVRKIEDKKTKGYFISIEHQNMTTVYGYLVSVYVTEGEKVVQGTKIGSLGTNKDGNKYLHFEIWVDNRPVDPSNYVNFSQKL